MTKSDTRNIAVTVRQILEMEEAGCELVRVAVPDMVAAEALSDIRRQIRIPLIADIHFDYRLALQAICNGVDALRLNPGNINDPRKITQIVNAARERQIPIRIGVNAGSLPDNIDPRLPVADRMVMAAMQEIELLEKLEFDLIKVSLKAFDIPTTVEAYRKIADKTNYPLHLGITEAGTPPAGTIRSAAGLALLLFEGIGDTIRVSLTASPVEEIDTAYEILQCLNIRNRGPVIISCPTCGRTEIDVEGITHAVRQGLKGCQKNIKVAIMGCAVNGPGEAREADIGIAGGKGKALLFRFGHKMRPVEENDIVRELLSEINRLA